MWLARLIESWTNHEPPCAEEVDQSCRCTLDCNSRSAEPGGGHIEGDPHPQVKREFASLLPRINILMSYFALLPQNDEMVLDLLKSLQGLPVSLDILQVVKSV